MRSNQPKFGITPIVKEHDMPGEIELVGEHYSPRQGVYIFGYAQECEGASEEAGEERFHAVVEFWDVRDQDVPFFITFLHPSNNEAEDGHYNFLEAFLKANEIISTFAPDADDPDIPVGQFLKALITADVKIEMEREAAMKQMFGGFLQSILRDAVDELGLDDDTFGEGDGGDDPLPGLFGGFDPFGR